MSDVASTGADTPPTLRQRVIARAKGFKTFAACGAAGLVGALNIVGTVDLTPVVKVFVREEAAIGLVMVLLAIGFGLLRFYTDSAPFSDGKLPDPWTPKKVDAGE